MAAIFILQSMVDVMTSHCCAGQQHVATGSTEEELVPKRGVASDVQEWLDYKCTTYPSDMKEVQKDCHNKRVNTTK